MSAIKGDILLAVFRSHQRKLPINEHPDMKYIVSQFLLAAAANASGADWPTDLWLDRGGFWTNRAEVVAENISGHDREGFGVAVPLRGGCRRR